jgi:hypothetical protein
LGLVFTLFVIVQSGSQFPVGWTTTFQLGGVLALLVGIAAPALRSPGPVTEGTARSAVAVGEDG